MASFPTAIKSFTTKVDGAGNLIAAEHINAQQDEIVAIETDLLKVWSSFVPTWTNGTIGDGSLTGKYLKLGKFVIFRIDLTWGSTTSSAGAWSFTFPVTSQTGASFFVAMGEAIDISTGQSWQVRGRLSSGTAFAVFTLDGASAAQVATTAPFTWVSTDELHLLGVIELP